MLELKFLEVELLKLELLKLELLKLKLESRTKYEAEDLYITGASNSWSRKWSKSPRLYAKFRLPKFIKSLWFNWLLLSIDCLTVPYQNTVASHFYSDL